MKMRLFFLHGFLGQPSDWRSITSALPYESICPDLFQDPRLSPETEISSWGSVFNLAMAKEHGGVNAAQFENVLIGYSMGGRLAASAFFAHNSIWKKLILISSNPGMEESERADREKFDSQWTQRFSSEPWDSLMAAWNSQGVFAGGGQEPQRREKDFDRETLVLALSNWSLTRQPDYRRLMNRKEILLVAGDLDSRYLQIAKKIKAGCPAMNLEIFKNSVHRIPFDQSNQTAELIKRFLH